VFFRLADLDSLKPGVLVFGAGRKASWALERLSQRSDRRGFRLIGFVDSGGPRAVYGDVPVFKFDEPLCEYVRRHRVDQIVVAVDDRRNSLPMPDLLKCRLAGVEVLELPTFFERETGTVALELTDPSWLVFGPGFQRGLFVRALKRALDVMICVVLMAIFSPIVLLTAIAIKLENGWGAPVMYSQTRVGEQGRHFRLYKLRSMRVDAEQSMGARWAHQNDERVTRVGRVIRKLRIDEIPQVVNVLRGDMSFVGPRPERPEFTQNLEREIRYYRERCSVKPGVTGWAQLRYPYGASAADAQEKLKYDLYYIKNHNMLFDILILLQTAEVVLFGKGAR
jgi:sugar transferase (PEP-CTERM system associated)